jgi:hypothetical protein
MTTVGPRSPEAVSPDDFSWLPDVVDLSADEIAAIGLELDDIYETVYQDLGAADEKYIRGLIKTQRSMALASRVAMCAGGWMQLSKGSPAIRRASWALTGAGMVGLGLAKILENMEVGHNVMHGQWDWMQDPEINSTVWEWDNVCPADQWKHGHNVLHHTWTNVLGMDRDIGYEIFRITPEQPWHPAYLAQPVYNAILMLLFEWGVGVHDVQVVVAGVPVGEARELVAEDHVVRVWGVVDVGRIGDVADQVVGAQHAHHRGDPAAGSDEQRFDRAALGKHEIALREANREVVADLEATNDLFRHPATGKDFGGDRDVSIGALRR